MKDYVLAHYKSSGRPILLRIMTHDGQMNPEMSKVDLTPNPEVSDRLASYVIRFMHLFLLPATSKLSRGLVIY